MLDVVGDNKELEKRLSRIAAGRAVLTAPSRTLVDKAAAKRVEKPSGNTAAFAPPSNCSRHTCTPVEVDGFGRFVACCCHQNEALWRREMGRSECAALAATATLQNLQLRMAAHVARRIVRRILSGAFGGWQLSTELRRRHRKCILLIHGARLARILRVWSWQARKERTIKEIVLRWQNRQVAAALEAWAASADEEARRRSVARRALGRMCNLVRRAACLAITAYRLKLA